MKHFNLQVNKFQNLNNSVSSNSKILFILGPRHLLKVITVTSDPPGTGSSKLIL